MLCVTVVGFSIGLRLPSKSKFQNFDLHLNKLPKEQHCSSHLFDLPCGNSKVKLREVGIILGWISS